MEGIGITLHPGHAICFGVNGMGKNSEIGFIPKSFIHIPHVGIHFGTDPFASGKKILYYIYFSLYVFLRNDFAVLVGERKWLNRIENWQFYFVVSRDDFSNRHIKQHEQRH